MSNEGKKIFAAGIIISIILLSLIIWLINFEHDNDYNTQKPINDEVNKSSLEDNELQNDSIYHQVNQDSRIKK